MLPIVDFRENVGTTQSYQLSSFERNPYLFVGPNTVEALDFDLPGNGKFDYLRVTVPVDLLYAGSYSWSAALLDSSGEEIAYYSTVDLGFSAGRHDFQFYFNGQDISRSQKNGPYTIGRIGIGGVVGFPSTPIGKDGDGSLEFLMTTGAYSYTQFEPPLRVKCSSFATFAHAGQTSAVLNYTLPAVTGQKDQVALSCSPPPGSSFNGSPNGVQTTVNCTAVEAGTNLTATCSFTITLYASGTDTTPPTIVAPAIAYAVIPYGQSSVPAYYYPVPTATDDSGAVTLTCSPTSGATLSRGLTYVNCTATDPAGNQSTATFPLRVFDISLQDDSSNNTLWFDSVTGDYYFFSCNGSGFNVAGRGSITLQSCQVKLNDPRVSATFIGCSYTTSGRRGSAVVKPNPVSGWYYITDNNANDNTATCPIR